MKKAAQQFTLWQVFRVPILIAVLSLFALVVALLGDGVWDAVGESALASSVAATLWAFATRRR